MNMQAWAKIVVGIILLGIFGGAVFYWTSYSIKKDNRSTEEAVSAKPTPEQQSNATPEDETQPEEVPIATPDVSSKQTSSLQQPTTDDCEQGCERFTLASELNYCKAFCGFDQAQYQNQDCESAVATEKDFCFKEKAIRERNTETCARIGERALRKACEARIAEEFFDE